MRRLLPRLLAALARTAARTCGRHRRVVGLLAVLAVLGLAQHAETASSRPPAPAPADTHTTPQISPHAGATGSQPRSRP
jgi:hypothetical protein